MPDSSFLASEGMRDRLRQHYDDMSPFTGRYLCGESDFVLLAVDSRGRPFTPFTQAARAEYFSRAQDERRAAREDERRQTQPDEAQHESGELQIEEVPEELQVDEAQEATQELPVDEGQGESQNLRRLNT